MFELLLDSYLLVIQTDLSLVDRREFRGAALANPCFFLLFGRGVVGPFSFVEVLVKSSEEIVAFLLLNAIDASWREIESVEVLIAVLKTVLGAALVAGKYLTCL